MLDASIYCGLSVAASEQVLGNNGSATTGSNQLSQGGERVKQQVNNISHAVREQYQSVKAAIANLLILLENYQFARHKNKLRDDQRDDNVHRCHSSRHGATLAASDDSKVVDINSYQWKKRCRGLFQRKRPANHVLPLR